MAKGDLYCKEERSRNREREGYGREGNVRRLRRSASLAREYVLVRKSGREVQNVSTGKDKRVGSTRIHATN